MLLPPSQAIRAGCDAAILRVRGWVPLAAATAAAAASRAREQLVDEVGWVMTQTKIDAQGGKTLAGLAGIPDALDRTSPRRELV
jgi:hypothetical protein